MQKALSDFLFGLFFGFGFTISAAVLHFIGTFFAGAHG